MALGRTKLPYTSGDLRSVIAGDDAQWRTAGVTIDWSTISALGSDTILPDGTFVKAGMKVLNMGQVLARIGAGAATIVTIAGAPTGGAFQLSVQAQGTVQTTSLLAFNASATSVQTALQGLSNVGTGLTCTGAAGGPFTIAAAAGYGPVGITADGSQLTVPAGAPAATATAVPTAATSGYGYFGPFDPAAVDGRAALARGECGIVPSTIVQGGVIGLNLVDTDHRGLLVGGRVYINRVIQCGGGTASLAAGPALAALLAAMPTLTPVAIAS